MSVARSHRLCHAFATACCAAALSAPVPALASRPALAALEVVDRHDGTVLPVYEKDGRQYIVGTPGREYTLRIRNRTGGRIVAVTSVDGVNVITGATASPAQAGYVIAPGGWVAIPGWRKTLEETASFYFTHHDASYAARTGRPLDVGVIGVAVFNEKPRPPSAAQIMSYEAEAPEHRRQADGASPSAAAPMPEAATVPNKQERAAGTVAAAPAPKLGTGHGRVESNRMVLVDFERATTDPAQTIVVQYDRIENLVAMGVVPSPQLARRAPDPFPGMGFVPDPPTR
ncbi:MAG TPA: hypothetical protein VF196_01690 [Casimicrobiaceae bacterium]